MFDTFHVLGSVGQVISGAVVNGVVNGSPDTSQYADFKFYRNNKLGIYVNYGSGPVGPPTPGVVTFLPAMGPNSCAGPYDMSQFLKPRIATNDPNAGIQSQQLAQAVLNAITGEWESFTVVTLLGGSESRWVVLQLENPDAANPYAAEIWFNASAS